MQVTTVLVLAAALSQSVLADYNRDYAPLTILSRRAAIARQEQALTCPETYGSGSMACGSSSLRLCFNPTAGESCCTNDGGFCKAGWNCAPVVGFCCKDGEDLATCAKNAGFELPASVGPIEGVPSSTTNTANPVPSTMSASAIGNATILPITAAPTTTTAAATGDDDDDCLDDEDGNMLPTPTSLSGGLTQIVVPVALTSAGTNTTMTATPPYPTTTMVAPVSQQQAINPATISINTDGETEYTAVPTIVQAAPASNDTLPSVIITTQQQALPTPASAGTTSVKPVVQVAGAMSPAPAPGSAWNYVLAVGAVVVAMAL